MAHSLFTCSPWERCMECALKDLRTWVLGRMLRYKEISAQGSGAYDELSKVLEEIDQRLR